MPNKAEAIGQVMRRYQTVILLAALLSSGIAYSEDMYKWVDAQGHVNVSDHVPPEYASKAVLLKNAIPPLQSDQDDARRRSEADRKRAADADKTGAAAIQENVPGGAAATVKAPLPMPAGTDCASRRAAFTASIVCYGPYNTANNSVKVEALAACGPPVLDPSSQCGAVTTP